MKSPVNTFERDLVGYLEPCLWLSIRDRATRKGDWPSSFKTVAYWVADHGQVVNPLLIVLYFFIVTTRWRSTSGNRLQDMNSTMHFKCASVCCGLFEMKMRRSTYWTTKQETSGNQIMLSARLPGQQLNIGRISLVQFFTALIQQ